MMNYFSFSPNFSLQLQQSPQAYPARTSLPTNFVLNTLSLALTNSLLNYQNTSRAQNNPPDTPTAPPPRPNPTKDAPLPSIPAGPIQTEIQLTVQKQNKGIPDQKSDILQITPKTEVKTSLLPIKADQRTEDKLPAVVAGREQTNKKRGQENCKVEGTKAETSRPTTIVPRVDLIQTAYISWQPLERKALVEKRSDLLGRQVQEWSEKAKNRRDKRELRLLQN